SESSGGAAGRSGSSSRTSGTTCATYGAPGPNRSARVPTSPWRRSVRITCTHGQKAGAPSPSQHRPQMTVAPRPVALVATHSASRVLPMPGSPAMRQSRPRSPMASPSAASSCASSPSRPTKSSAAARSISSRSAVGGGDESGDTGAIPSAVPVRGPLGDVRAEDPGADWVLEVETESRMLACDPRNRLADAAGHRLARPVARVRGLTRPALESVGGRQLLAQELDLTANLLRPARVGPLGRLGQLGLQGLEP